MSNLQNDIIREDEHERELEMKCKCGKGLTQGVYKYSMNAFKKPLCIPSQKAERIKQNPTLGKLVNDQIEKDYNKKIGS